MKRVSILQEYVPEYRVPFFQALRERCTAHGIDLSVYAGGPHQALALRSDAVENGLSISLRQRDFTMLGRRVTLRATRDAVLGADLVVLEQARRNLDAYRVLLPRRTWPASRVAMWGHGRDFVADRSRLETRLHQSLTRRVDHFFAYTDSGARHVTALGLEPSQVTVVRNSTDTRAFEKDLRNVTDEDLARFRDRHRLTAKTLLYVGGLDPSKRLDVLFEGFSIAQRADPELALLVAGDGPQRSLVERVASEHDRITYLGRLNGPEKALAFRASAALSVPGRVGLVAVDSIVSGLPILTTDWRFHAPEFEYLVPGETCFVSDLSRAAYGELLLELLRAPSRLTRASRGLRDEAPRYGVEMMADNFMGGILAMGVGQRPPTLDDGSQ